MERRKSSGDSSEEEAQKEPSDEGGNLESIKQLSWSCLHSCGGESGREAKEGTGLWVLCHQSACSHKNKARKKNKPTAYHHLNCPHRSFICAFRMKPFELSFQAERSPTSPQLRSKQRVRTADWHRSSLCQHSSSPYSLTQLPPRYFFALNPQHFCFVALALSMGEFDLGGKKKSERRKHTL